jgi:hypothetical protein
MDSTKKSISRNQAGCNLPEGSRSTSTIPSSAAGRQQNRGDEASNDPWFLYGGNIAAACLATNESVVYTRKAETDSDRDKQRQRASSRLTAWQSRERKRIEFEVMQERKAELTQRNNEIRTENDEMKRLIQRLKEASQLGSHSMAAASRVSAMQGSAQASAMARMDGRGNLFYHFPGSQRLDLPSLHQQHTGLFFQSMQSPGHDLSMVSSTIFAPLTRNPMQSPVQMPFHSFTGASQLQMAFGTPYLRTTSQVSLKRQVGRDLGHTSQSNKRPRQEARER